MGIKDIHKHWLRKKVSKVLTRRALLDSYVRQEEETEPTTKKF